MLILFKFVSLLPIFLANFICGLCHHYFSWLIPFRPFSSVLLSVLFPYNSSLLPHSRVHTAPSLPCLFKLAQAQLSRGFESQWERLGQSVLFTPSDILKRWRDQTPLLYCRTWHTACTHIHTTTHISTDKNTYVDMQRIAKTYRHTKKNKIKPRVYEAEIKSYMV